MTGSAHNPSEPSGRPGRQLARDAALRRIVSARRAATLGTAGLTAGFVGLVADLAPGHSAHAVTRPRSGAVTATGSSSRAAPRLPPLASASALGLKGSGAPSPQAAPAPSQPAPSQPPAAPSQPPPAPSQPPAAHSQPPPAASAGQSASAPAPVVSGGS